MRQCAGLLNPLLPEIHWLSARELIGRLDVAVSSCHCHLEILLVDDGSTEACRPADFQRLPPLTPSENFACAAILAIKGPRTKVRTLICKAPPSAARPSCSVSKVSARSGQQRTIRWISGSAIPKKHARRLHSGQLESNFQIDLGSRPSLGLLRSSPRNPRQQYNLHTSIANTSVGGLLRATA